jgi:thiol-disulfide isomerase/thioredoxin
MPLVEATPASSSTETETPSSLAIGDNAPSLSIDHWVKGAAIDGFNDDQVYVIEFWATWCGPCVASMPHLSSIQDEYGDSVKIIGVSSEKELETVTEFLIKENSRDGKINNDRMRYTVAFDSDRTTSNSYMKAAGQKGIPRAFIIDDNGKVAWIGHPMNMDDPLSEIVDGTWDLAGAAAAFEKEAAQEQALDKFWTTFRSATLNEDWDTLITTIDEFTVEYGENPQLSEMKFEALLTGKNDKVAAYAWAETMVKAYWDNPNALNGLAWGIVDDMPDEYRDLDFALRIAVRACEITDYKDAMILDTLARAHWERDETYKAIAWQQEAVEYSKGGPMSDSIQATLDTYQATLANVNSE